MREGWARVGGARGAGSRERLLGIRHSQSLFSVNQYLHKTSLHAYRARCRCLPPSARKLRRRANGADMTTVVFSIQHAGAAKLEEIVVEVHPEWAPIGAQCVRPARTT